MTTEDYTSYTVVSRQPGDKRFYYNNFTDYDEAYHYAVEIMRECDMVQINTVRRQTLKLK